MRARCAERRGRLLAVLACAGFVGAALAGCASEPPSGPAGADAGADASADAGADASADAGAGAVTDAVSGADAVTGAPDAGPAPADNGGPSDSVAPAPPVLAPPAGPRCPPEMVRVARRFCVDRYEVVLLDKQTGLELSAFYPPSRKLAESAFQTWSRMRFQIGNDEARGMELPLLPGWQREHDVEPRAISRKGVLPQGYTSGAQAALACRNAGKRLCTLEEWRTACRGERGEPFPYGPAYEPGRCNVFREAHPASVLHRDPSMGHSDPRLNLVEVEGRPLLRRTGETATCRSAWEGDAIADMVGNIDEWVDDPEGTFVGGFYARATKEGCTARITTHAFTYSDYSIGVRCCADLPPRGLP